MTAAIEVPRYAIATLAAGVRIVSFYLLTACVQKTARNNKPFLNLTLSDRTGSIDARLFDATIETAAIAAGDVVKIAGEVEEFNGDLQIRVAKIRVATTEEGLRPADFLPRSEREPAAMLADLVDLLHGAMDRQGVPYAIVSRVYETYTDRILAAPAAKLVHHAYVGGLIEHVLSLATSADRLAGHYRLDRDMLLAIACLHDIGKIEELSAESGFGYTVSGNLVGHILIGIDMVRRAAAELRIAAQHDATEVDRIELELVHAIAAHHGRREDGSPVLPQTREAIAFHFLDNLDARLATADAALRTDRTPGAMTDRVWALGAPVYRPAAARSEAP